MLSLVAAVVTSWWASIALFVYAFRHSARLPLEGVSFVSLLGAMLGFFLAVAGFALFQYLPNEFRNVRTSLEKDAKEFGVKRVRLASNIAYGLALVFMFVVLALVGYIGSLFFPETERRSIWFQTAVGGGAVVAASSLILFIGINFEKDSVWPPRMMLAAFGVTLLGVMYFSTRDPFDDFLRDIRFGGGMNVTITVDGAQPVASCLFLVSDSAVTLFDADRDQYIEFPRERVSTIRYSPDPESCSLPDRSRHAEGLSGNAPTITATVKTSPMLVCCGGRCK